MIRVNPSIEILSNTSYETILKKIERIGRVCYKSEDKIKEDSAEGFIRAIIKRGHESVIEHESISVKVTCDRGVTHEIVRHRIASYSQESTRYCNYTSDKFSNQISCIDIATGFHYDLDNELTAKSGRSGTPPWKLLRSTISRWSPRAQSLTRHAPSCPTASRPRS